MSGDLSLADIVHDNARRFPDAIAYRDGEEAITHRQLLDSASRLLAALRSAGVGRGDRVAVMGRNSIGFAVVLAAAQISGIVLTTLSFRSAAPEVQTAIARVDPRVVFCDREFASLITAYL